MLLHALLSVTHAVSTQAATEALQNEAMEMGKSMYSQGAPPPGAEGAPGAGGPGGAAAPGAGPSGGAGGDDNVVDAEFTDSGDK